MGHINIRLYDSTDRDDAHPIGSTPRMLAVTLRRTVRAGNELVYASEEPAWFQFVERRVTLGKSSDHRFWRLEIKSASDVKHGPQPDESAVVTEHPYGDGRVATAKFKRASHADKYARSVSATSAGEIESVLQDLSNDPWETRKLLTAGFTRDGNGKGRRTFGKRASFVLGVCEDLEAFREMLAESEPARKLVALAQEGRLRAGINNKDVQKILINREVGEEAKLAIRIAAAQALAGPGPGHEDLPITKVLEFIFKDHLYNLARQAWREGKHTVQRHPPSEDGPSGD